MKTVNTPTTEEIEITFARHQFSGYGHREISVDIVFNGVQKTFKSVTSDLEGIYAADEHEGDERYIRLYGRIETNIEERVAEWIYELKEENA